MSLYGRWMHRRERQLTLVDTNRQVFPFEWGLDWLDEETYGTSPLTQLQDFSEKALAESDTFFRPPELKDWTLQADQLSFPSPLACPDACNNTTACRLFESEADRAVIVIPQWNADENSHVTLCRVLQRLGFTALRMVLPYHESRMPAGMVRADHMVSPNVGRTLQATRQAVLEVRQAAVWLRERGYSRVGVLGTSMGSCVGYLAFVHDPRLEVGVFNHVSSYYADVVWHGLATRYVRWGLEGNVSLEDLRSCWKPVSPIFHVGRLRDNLRPHLMITARYDLTFPPRLSELVFEEYKRLSLPYERVVIPCGHYTTAHFPYNYLDAWHICRYFRRHLSSS
jgi:hypothetical protein